ncbi:MAG: hypothetical protein H6538_07960 [Bacteroidales bacterium]|nr:hypothetical protein [Bacteroidales bacterium]MCB9000031.1 hypothetical protein [Bacteroidales bacterium]MCB9013605.1 hypothetical protein [Bacteroidales bacterium]
MKKKGIIITSAILLISIANYTQFISHSNLRAVEFLSIFAIGALTGILAIQIIQLIKK